MVFQALQDLQISRESLTTKLLLFFPPFLSFVFPTCRGVEFLVLSLQGPGLLTVRLSPDLRARESINSPVWDGDILLVLSVGV